MALRERAASGILARKPNRRAVQQQRAEGERLAGRPVDVFAAFDHLALGIQLPGDLLVDVEVLGEPRESHADFAQPLQRNAGIAAARIP